MKKQLQKALEISAITGDKIIVVDEKSDKGMAILPLDEYEKLLQGQNKAKLKVSDLTEEEMLDKINRDINKWKEARGYREENDDFGPLEFSDDEEDDEIPFFLEGEDRDGCFSTEDPESDTEAKPESDEDLYYYQEPSYAKATEDKPERNGFVSIKDELKARKNWEIPVDMKKKAEEVKEIPF